MNRPALLITPMPDLLGLTRIRLTRAFLTSAPLTAALLTGCVSARQNYPSLAPRAVEKLGFAEPVVPVVEAAPDPALDARIAAKRTELTRIAQGFATAAATTDRAARAARGQSVGSDAWLDAQSNLAGLDDWRAQTSSLVTDIEQMIAERAAALAPVYAPLIALRDAAVAEAATQSDTIDRIQTTLPAA